VTRSTKDEEYLMLGIRKGKEGQKRCLSQNVDPKQHRSASPNLTESCPYPYPKSGSQKESMSGSQRKKQQT